PHSSRPMRRDRLRTRPFGEERGQCEHECYNQPSFHAVTPSARGYALVDVDVPARHWGAREAGDAAASTDVAVWGKETHEEYFVSHAIGRVVFCDDGTQHGRLRLPVGRRDEE